jgi:hypothetical protein
MIDQPGERCWATPLASRVFRGFYTATGASPPCTSCNGEGRRGAYRHRADLLFPPVADKGPSRRFNGEHLGGPALS